MEMETSQRQRGVFGATCETRAAEKHPPQGAKALKCASFAFEMPEILLEVCYEYKCTLSSFEEAYSRILQKYFVQFSVCFVFKGCCCRWTLDLIRLRGGPSPRSRD